MTRVVPMAVFKEWKGSNDERFRHTDINRLSAAVKTIADMLSFEYDPITASRADMFDYNKMYTMEATITILYIKLKLDYPKPTVWKCGRAVTYADFEKVENNIWKLYKVLNGEGGRIPWNKDRKFDPFTLYADNWTGTGPYFYELPTSFGAEYDEGLVFVRAEATAGQRFAEHRAIITVKSSASGVVLQANGAKPRENIPIIITRGIPAMKETATLSASNWTGTGPWFQTIMYSETVIDGVVTISEGATSSQAREFADCGISASAVNGKQVTYRAVLKKPEMDLPVLLIFENSEST